jgi:hypothetical protein
VKDEWKDERIMKEPTRRTNTSIYAIEELKNSKESHQSMATTMSELFQRGSNHY